MTPATTRILLGLLALFALLSGCATAEKRNPDDPLERSNRSFHNFNDSLDRNIMVPVARGYNKAVPGVVRQGVTNFFDNVTYLNVIANDLLQFKLGRFLQDSTRFVVNSTMGLGGLLDPATDMDLPKGDEDLGQTFGVWGAGEGAYLVIPFFGPNSVRDAPDLAMNRFLNPLTYFALPISLPFAALDTINNRANLLETTELVEEAALDPYSYIREAYRQRRQYQIYDGNPPIGDLEEFIEQDEAEPGGVLRVE
jgi:phospholipid-binding lipoprotein MlaA